MYVTRDSSLFDAAFAYALDVGITSHLLNFHATYHARTEGKKGLGLGAPVIRQSLVAETRNMSPLGGADHGRAERWSELELPLVDFMLGARQVLRRSDTSTRDPIISSVLYRISESCVSRREHAKAGPVRDTHACMKGRH